MGAGKSTVGRRLARKLKMRFFDTDQEIEKRTGATVALIFEIEGEPGFRKREADVIDELTQQSNIILATGGGAILDPDNRKKLSERGFLIYLRTRLDHLVQRTFRDTKRPLLQTENPTARLAELLAIRGPLYEDLADLIIDTDGRTVQSVVDEVAGHKIWQ